MKHVFAWAQAGARDQLTITEQTAATAMQIIAQSLSFVNSWLAPDGRCGETQKILIVSNSNDLGEHIGGNR